MEEAISATEELVWENSRKDGVAELSLRDMAALYRRLLVHRTSATGLIVQVIGPHARVGVTSIVHGLGRAATELSGHRALLCDATGSGDLLRVNRSGSRQGLERLLAFERTYEPGELVACSLHGARESPGELATIGRSAESFKKARGIFDVVVFDSPPANSSDVGQALASRVDVVIVVIEAEKTRMPLVSSLLTSLDRNGGKVVGVVLNKRVQHIPRLIYRCL